MTHAHGGLLIVLVAFALGAVIANALLAVGAVVVKDRSLRNFAPTEVARVALAAMAAPLVLGALFVVGTLKTPLLALAAPELDHCLAHVASAHVCFVHGTWSFGSVVEGVGASLLLGAFLFSLAREFVRVRRAMSLAVALCDARGASRVDDVTFTDDTAAYAFTLGLVRPRIIVSDGLRRVLDARQLDVAIAHERAHARHRDALLRAISRVVSPLVFPPLRRALTRLLILGQERRADEEAALVVESRAMVAETLLTLVRHGATSLRFQGQPSLHAHAITARIESLCDDVAVARVSRVALVVVSAGMAAVTLSGTHVHHTSEFIATALVASPVHSVDDDSHSNSHSHSHSHSHPHSHSSADEPASSERRAP